MLDAESSDCRVQGEGDEHPVKRGLGVWHYCPAGLHPVVRRHVPADTGGAEGTTGSCIAGRKEVADRQERKLKNQYYPHRLVHQFHPSLRLYTTSFYDNSLYNLPRKLPHVFRSGDGHSLTVPLKALPPAKEIPLTFVAGIKSWWEAGECQLTCGGATFTVRLRFTFQTVAVPNPFTQETLVLPLRTPTIPLRSAQTASNRI